MRLMALLRAGPHSLTARGSSAAAPTTQRVNAVPSMASQSNLTSTSGLALYTSISIPSTMRMTGENFTICSRLNAGTIW